MTNQIKSARNDVQAPILMPDGTTKWVSIEHLYKALSAYEKLQGVDLETLKLECTEKLHGIVKVGPKYIGFVVSDIIDHLAAQGYIGVPEGYVLYSKKNYERADNMFRFLNHKKMVQEFNEWRAAPKKEGE